MYLQGQIKRQRILHEEDEDGYSISAAEYDKNHQQNTIYNHSNHHHKNYNNNNNVEDDFENNEDDDDEDYSSL